MTRERSKHGSKLGFLMRRQHESFEIAKPNRRTRLMGENSARRVHEFVQRKSC